MISFKKCSAKTANSICDEELLDRVSETGSGMGSDRFIYILVLNDKQSIGFICYSWESSVAVKIHVNFLKEHRVFAKEASEKFLEVFFNNMKDLQRIECDIPVIYQDVITFAGYLFFKKEGIKRQATTRKGKLIDCQIMALLREEYYELR